jgi:soluble lytic murein transglycosylase-like protein
MLKTKYTIIFIAILWLLSLPSHADIYKYVDKYGRVVLTDKPKHNGYKRLVKTWKGWEEYKIPKNFNWVKNQKKYDSTIKSIAKSYKLPHTLLHAVITAESSYNPDAISKAGAVGLMQLMPETAKQYGVKNRRNPRENIYGGTRYLRYLLKLFNNNLVLALAAYNAGEGTVKKYGNKVPPYKETRNYVNKVIKYYNKYKVSMS